MALSDVWDEFATSVKGGFGGIAKDLVAGGLEAAQSDSEAFLLQSRDRLEKWTNLLLNGDINQEDFASLVKGQRALATLMLLKQAGLQAARVQALRTKLLDLVVKSAFMAIGL